MELIYSLPLEIERAKSDRIPLIIPVGTIEYHGPHCPYGCDGNIIEGILKEFQKKKQIVLYPTIWYSAGSYLISGPEKNTMDIDTDVFINYVSEIVRNLLEGGWRNIYFLIHHQYLNEILQPMTLSCMISARKTIFKFLEKSRGRGWWGDNKNNEYYEQFDSNDNPFNWVKTIPIMSKTVQLATGYDHAGKYETSFQAYLHPETVNLERLKDSDEWFIKTASQSSIELGQKMAELTLANLLERIL